MQKPSPIVTILVVAILILAGYNVYGLLTAQHSVSSLGQIATLGVDVYQDRNLTMPLTQVNWGMLRPGDVVTYKAYVLNSGNVPVNLTMTVTNWAPSEALNYINLTWDAEQWILPPNSNVAVTFTLSVDPTIHDIEQFSNIAIIRGAY